jgi:signal transduction histidine kinase
MENTTIVSCKNIEKEIRKVIKIRDLKNIKVDSYHCNFVNNCRENCNIGDILSKYSENKKSIFLVKNSCLHSQKIKSSIQNYYLKGYENLYELFLPKNLVNYYHNEGYYILTSGGVKFWLNNIDDWELNKNKISEFSSVELKKLLILDTDIGLKTKDLAEEIYQKLKIPYEILPTGLDVLELHLTKLLNEFKLREEKQASLDHIIEANEQIANYEMAFDMIKILTQLKVEEEVIKCIINIFETLFSPKSIVFGTIKENQLDNVISRPSDVKLNLKRTNSFLTQDKEYLLVEENSFLLKLKYKGSCYGIVNIREIEFPEYLSRYLSLAMITGRICALAINNARVYQKLDNTLKRLRESNKDLEEFAYMISHDLKQPLTIIIGYLNLVKEIYEGKIERSPLKPLKAALKSSYAMNQMINDILDYSRLSRKEEHKRLLDLNNNLNRAISNLKTPIEETNAQISSDELPQVFADETVIVQIFQNLIDNAIKYRSEKPPKIHISSQKKNNYYKIMVKDNGIGVDPKEMDKLFDLFYRSNKTQEISGSGIGLSICNKLIKRLGGEIGVETNSNEGSTFYFTLPIIK